MERRVNIPAALVLAVMLTLGFFSIPSHASKRTQASKRKIFAQSLIEQALSKHPDVSSMELSIVSGTWCSTIAASAKDVGEECDRDELEPMRTGMPFVERDRNAFDVTLPLHDTSGQIIGAIGMNLRPKSGEPQSSVVERAKTIAEEFEARIPAKARLFEFVD